MNGFRSVVDWIQRNVKSRLHRIILPHAVQEFQARATVASGLEHAVQLTYGFNYFGIRVRPAQVRAEILTFLLEIEHRPPKVVLEIGTASGGSLFLFSRIAVDNALLISVDLPGGMFGGGYPASRAPLYQAFARDRQRVELLQADSHDPSTVERVTALLGGRTVDLLFIDGDHSYDGVRLDFEMYSPLVSSGGVIGFHDIVPGPESDVGGVPRFWRTLKESAPTAEIVSDWAQGGYGIGYTTKVIGC